MFRRSPLVAALSHMYQIFLTHTVPFKIQFNIILNLHRVLADLVCLRLKYRNFVCIQIFPRVCFTSIHRVFFIILSLVTFVEECGFIQHRLERSDCIML